MDPSQPTVVEVDRQINLFINQYQLPDGPPPYLTYQDFITLFDGIAVVESTYEGFRLRGTLTHNQRNAAQ